MTAFLNLGIKGPEGGGVVDPPERFAEHLKPFLPLSNLQPLTLQFEVLLLHCLSARASLAKQRLGQLRVILAETGNGRVAEAEWMSMAESERRGSGRAEVRAMRARKKEKERMSAFWEDMVIVVLVRRREVSLLKLRNELKKES